MDLIGNGENRGNISRLPTTTEQIFSAENLRQCERYVLLIQRRLDKAVANDDKSKIRWYSHILMKRSRSAKILSVNRICNKNQGRYTAGVDGVSMPKTRQERLEEMQKLLNTINIEDKPSPSLRIEIPKPNGKKRPLGIPTIKDRINQDIIRQAIEPITEYHFMPCSNGFRPKRSCQDAMQGLFTKLARKNAPKWIIEGDIKGCFDHINHDHIISTLMNWKVPETTCRIIKRMLKSGIVWNDQYSLTDEGTPQGGVISPMLANVALNCLDTEILNKFGRRHKGGDRNPIVRYADDFIIVARNEKVAIKIKSHIKEFLKTNIGVELSDEKTHITHISDGFNFLGFNFRKYQGTLLIKPQKDKVQDVKRNLKRKTQELVDTPAHVLITQLNPIINGWGNYYRHVVSKQIFASIGTSIWENTWRWAIKKHPHRAKKELRKWYYRNMGNRQWIFYDRKTRNSLAQMDKIPIKRFTKVNQKKRVYNEKDKDYWKQREYTNAKNSIYGSYIMTELFKAQRGKCESCGKPFTQEQIQSTEIHRHHMKPKSEGGDEKLGNLRLLHDQCHTSLHGRYSRKDMARFMSNRIDYLRLLKPQT